MPDFINLPCCDDKGNYYVVVEAPHGSCVKLKYDPEKNAFVFNRALLLGVVYPYEWGFIPSTRAEDDDPLDVMVMFEGRTWPGVIIPSRPIGVVRLVQRETKKSPREHNDRIIAVPTDDLRYSNATELPKRVRKELEEFFITASRMTHKEVVVKGWEGPRAARALIHAAAEAYIRRGAS